MSLLGKIIRVAADACLGKSKPTKTKRKKTRSNSGSDEKESPRKGGLLRGVIGLGLKITTIALPRMIKSFAGATIGFVLRKSVSFFGIKPKIFKKGVKESAEAGLKSMAASLLSRLMRHLADIFLGDSSFGHFNDNDKDYFRNRSGNANSRGPVRKSSIVVDKDGVIITEVDDPAKGGGEFEPDPEFISEEFQREYSSDLTETLYQDQKLFKSDDGAVFNPYGDPEPASGM